MVAATRWVSRAGPLPHRTSGGPAAVCEVHVIRISVGELVRASRSCSAHQKITTTPERERERDREREIERDRERERERETHI